jgi:hypothetical protein
VGEAADAQLDAAREQSARVADAIGAAKAASKRVDRLAREVERAMRPRGTGTTA